MVQRPLTSAAGVLSLLSESDTTLRQHALVALNPLVPQFWAEISENLTEMYAQFIFYLTRRAEEDIISVNHSMKTMIYLENLANWLP